jgi:hypothetical protein
MCDFATNAAGLDNGEGHECSHVMSAVSFSLVVWKPFPKGMFSLWKSPREDGGEKDREANCFEKGEQHIGALLPWASAFRKKFVLENSMPGNDNEIDPSEPGAAEQRPHGSRAMTWPHDPSRDRSGAQGQERGGVEQHSPDEVHHEIWLEHSHSSAAPDRTLFLQLEFLRMEPEI